MEIKIVSENSSITARSWIKLDYKKETKFNKFNTLKKENNGRLKCPQNVHFLELSET